METMVFVACVFGLPIFRGSTILCASRYLKCIWGGVAQKRNWKAPQRCKQIEPIGNTY